MTTTAKKDQLYEEIKVDDIDVFGEPTEDMLFGNCDVSDLCEETFSHEHHRTRQRWNFDIVTDKPVEKCAYPTLDYLPEQLPFENSYFCRPSRSSDIRNSSCSSSSANSTEGGSSWDDYDVAKDVIANSDSNKSDTNS